MPSFTDLLQQGAGVAIRGTVGQADLLGLSATVSHTAVVWVVALIELYLSSHWNPETSEPYFQIVSAMLIVGVAVWMLARTWRDQQREKQPALHQHHAPDDHAHHDHAHHGHDHQHRHHDHGLDVGAPGS